MALILFNLFLQPSYLLLAMGNLELVGPNLAFHWRVREQSHFNWMIYGAGALRRFFCSVSLGLRFELLFQLLCRGNLFLYMPYVRMIGRITRVQIRELGVQPFQLLIDACRGRHALLSLTRTAPALGLGQRLEIKFLLVGLVERFFRRLQTGLETGEYLRIALPLFRQFSQVSCLEITKALFLLGQIAAGLIQLVLEKFGGIFGEALLVVQVFVNEQRSQLVGYLLCQHWARRCIRDFEC